VCSLQFPDPADRAGGPEHVFLPGMSKRVTNEIDDWPLRL